MTPLAYSAGSVSAARSSFALALVALASDARRASLAAWSVAVLDLVALAATTGFYIMATFSESCFVMLASRVTVRC
jgi:hypothetical protein